MKVAIVHPYPVWSGAVGGTTRVHALVRHLVAAGHQVTVLAHSSGRPEVDRAAIADLETMGARQELFPLRRPSLLSKIRWAVGPTPYVVQRNRNPGLEAALAALAPDVVHVEHGCLAPILDVLDPGSARVLAEQENGSMAIDRLRHASGRSPFEWYLSTQGWKVRAFERAAYRGFDHIWAITPREADHLRDVTGRRVGILPHVVDTDSFRPSGTRVDAERLLFVGNYGHGPNWHALSWFLEQVWPLLREEAPCIPLDVVGPGLSPRSRRRVERAGATAAGRVADLAGAYRGAAVFVNPIRTGGGMRGKVLEAFSCGCAVVSTAMGMEGIDARNGEHCLLADAPEEFAGAVLRYLRDPTLRSAHGLAARKLAERSYDPRNVFPRLEAEFQALAGRRRRQAS